MKMSLWRPLLVSDLPAVAAIAEIAHPDFPEDDAVFADRIAIAPDTCLLLEKDGAPLGYVLAHPYEAHSLPALNSTLGFIPQGADTLYIHDLALLPAARGTGAARAAVSRLADLARPYGSMSLVAVNGSVPFWTSMGFAAQTLPHLAEKLATYSADACYMVRTNTE